MRKIFKMETDEDIVTLHETEADLPIFGIGDHVYLPDKIREYKIIGRYWCIDSTGTCELIYSLK